MHKVNIFYCKYMRRYTSYNNINYKNKKNKKMHKVNIFYCKYMRRYTSYYNLSSVTDSVCALSPRPFMDLQAPNSAGRSGMVTENTSRKRNFKIPIGCHGNKEILLRPRYWSEGAEFFRVKHTLPCKFACKKSAKSTSRFKR